MQFSLYIIILLHRWSIQNRAKNIDLSDMSVCVWLVHLVGDNDKIRSFAEHLIVFPSEYIKLKYKNLSIT